MDLLLKAIFREPFVLLGIFFLIVGAASLLFKVFNATQPANKHTRKSEKQNLNKAFVFVLIAILIGVIVFIYWLRSKQG